ncbi:glycosyl transferase, group 1 family protein [Diplocarpon rosae]|nr:glycosyl transferase, group 1 family protein [Diplocarpon rosae]
MKPKYLGLSAVGWKLMVRSWWDKLIAGVLLASVVLGSLYVLYRISCRVWSFWRGQHQQAAVPTAVARHLDRLVGSGEPLAIERGPEGEPKSFGIFLGSFASPPTATQAYLLSKWEVIVLDPTKEGVLHAISACQGSPPHILGRLDLRELAKSETSSSSEDVNQLLSALAEYFGAHFRDQTQMPFTGVLLAGFRSHLQPVVLNATARYISGLGLDLWLEIDASPLACLTQRECREIKMDLVRGVVYRNGTIRPDGDQQNYFHMTEMRTAMRTIAAQQSRTLTMMWETIDDGVNAQYAIVQRSFQWSQFNSALCWIGSAASLEDADIATEYTINQKPLGGLMWLKDEDNMKAHDLWRANEQVSSTPRGHEALYESLQSFIPGLAEKLRHSPPGTQSFELDLIEPGHAGIVNRHHSYHSYSQPHPLSASAGGEDFAGLGCFHLGLEVVPREFGVLLQTQRHLKELNLLQRVEEEEILRFVEQIRALHDANEIKETDSLTTLAIKELVDLLSVKNEDGVPRIQVFVGLHSGFQTGPKVQFWGLYDLDALSGTLNIYLSSKTQDRVGTLLHTFLSSRGCSRTECFLAEQALAELNGNLSKTWQLAPRMVHDLEQLSPEETISFIRRLVLSGHGYDFVFLAKIRACCEYQVMEMPTLTQIRTQSAIGYLSGELSSADLITARLTWLREKGCWVPDTSAAISLFEEIDERVHEVLMNCETETLAQLGFVIQSLMRADRIDASADIFALSVFSAFRKLSLDEILLEILDRNPLPNHATDQAGCFAENFALGSRCDSFFDMTTRDLGRILSARYRSYYMKHQPPPREEGFTDLPSAYAAMQIDLDPQNGEEKITGYYQVTFLGIFAVPALIDIMLLTTVGRGLYLTTFMSSTEKTMATTALMLALLACGAVGSWISSGGSYYVFANAFPAMNMFVLTRFVAGLAIVIFTASGALITLAITKGIVAGLVFAFYFAMLATYLMVLSALSIYQVPGSSFQSGRTVIMCCIPILFISPLLSLWIGHDIAVYFCVLTIFLFSLLYGARKTMAQWTTWYLHIPFVTDGEVVRWYMKTKEASSSLGPSEDMREISTGPSPRIALHAAVLKECNRHLWTKATSDPLVSRLATGYSSTMFLMGWFCKFKRTRMPLAYSATWNLTLKAAFDNMGNMQKGLKLHSAFLHWRHTGDDIWSGILYFVVALLDKWAALVSGGSLVGLSSASSERYRLAVGFGLCYYLIGAVSLDTVSQPLWTAANQATNQPITSLKFLRQAMKNDAKARRALYWRSLAKFFFMHIWGISITSALMWVFEPSRDATVMYLAYIGAYTGLLWYQYNKIYCATDSAKCLGVAFVIGFPAGIALHRYLPHFAYSGVIGLSIGTWIAAAYSMWLSKIGWPRLFSFRSRESTEDLDAKCTPVLYSVSALEPHPDISQATLSQMFVYVSTLPAEQRHKLEPSHHPGATILDFLLAQSRSRRAEIVQNAFPSAEQILQRTAALWRSGKTVVELISAQHFPQQEQKVRMISQTIGDRLHLFVVLGLDLEGDGWRLNANRNSKIIAEAIVQATSESQLGLSHNDSILAELLVASDSNDGDLSLPEGIKRQIETSAAERIRVIANGDRILLRHLLLGIDCEREWDTLPKRLRVFLLKRSCGHSRAISASEESWIRSRTSKFEPVDPEEYVARCDLGAALTVSTFAYAKSQEEISNIFADPKPAYLALSSWRLLGSTALLNSTASRSSLDCLKICLSLFHQKTQICIKFLCLSLSADPEYQRELDYTMQAKPMFVRWPVVFILNGIWSFCKTLQGIILPLVMFHGRENIAKLHSNLKGMKTVLEKNRIVIECLEGPSTCFGAVMPDGSRQLAQYAGLHDKVPLERKKLMAINTYSNKMVLSKREEFKNETSINLFKYEYRQDGKKSSLKLPLQRECLKGDRAGQIVQYDQRGYITTGSTFRGVNPVNFTYWYRKSAKFEDELIRGEYVFPHVIIRVSWSMPGQKHPERLDEWIPFTKVTEATFIQGSEVYHASWTYEHKSHPEISTTLNGELVATPPMIHEDWFRVLQKPDKCSFLHDNPLLPFSSVESNFLSRLLGLNIRRYPISTSQARTQLWKTWKSGKEIDAVTARWLDESLLRSDGVLRSYWRNRDLGRLDAAKDYLDAQADTIMARVDVDPEISSWVHIAYKISDFYSMGTGGDTRINTRTVSTQLRDSDDELHILSMDTSTWPNEPGGVSACRRDMVNDLKTIRWHVVAESANDYGVPKFQIERNVQSLTVIPQWGLDFLNPTHGVLQNILDSEVASRSFDTRSVDIRANFLPILESLVRTSRALHLNREHIEEATKALCDLNTYFESSRNWNDVWDSDIVKQAWRELWLTENMPDALPISKWWDFEKPTMLQMDQALNMWHRYLFIFSIPVPEKIPDVFQASHHFTGAGYGIVCKVKRQCTLHVWDHCISFRELTNFMSSAVSFDTPFINSSLISLGHMGCVLLEHHADVVLPCAAYFNPGWEVELGTAEGNIEHRRTFVRKIDPVVNGICNMEKFEPIKKLKTDKPTAVMLSHVQYIKDIKNAILATDFIVNKWGFTDYSLHIYGDMERAASYSTECQELIASKGLRDHCVLKGLGNPSLVLQDAWLFLNSSLSEGLPLAMGEAALTGTPVVCTDVGASFCVVTDGETGDRFSEVVPPNDSESLARAQINILALLGRWSVFADDLPGGPPQVLAYPNPSPEEVKQITQRMYDKTDQRRKLGMLGRENVLKNFSSDRYLREHEQMLWIGKYRSRTYHNRSSRPPSAQDGNSWVRMEKSSAAFGASVVTPPRRSPRLTPETWSLSSASEKKGRLRKKSPRIPYEQRYTQSSIESSLQGDEVVVARSNV